MRITPTSLIFFLVVASVPVLCDTREPPVLHPEAPPATSSLFAPLDDVHLLSNGLLQLGQSMREFVQKTKGQITTIFQKLNIFDRSFSQLSALAGEIKEGEEELKETAVVLNTHNEEIKELSEKISSKMESLLQEKSQLLNKVESLAEKLSSLSVGPVTITRVAEINSLREVIQQQEQSIGNLMEAMKEQGRSLDHQTMKIKVLEEKLAASTSAQETFEKKPEISKFEPPTPSPYLTSGTRSTAVMHFPSDCSELFERGERADGTYTIRPNGSEPFMVFCDMSRGHGATVIQQRKDGSMNFDQPWEKYEDGFGDLQWEFWLGLKKTYSLASQGNYVLHIQLEDWKQNRHFMEYRFHLEGPERSYAIQLIHLSGSLPNPMNNHTGVVFSTKDRDNGSRWASRCAHPQSGGWWFRSCGDTNLNERYLRTRANGRSERRRGIQWKSGPKPFYSFTFTQISIRPADSISPISPASAPSDATVRL
ncbi:angiopoietin-related protein 3 isoform X2 [Fundulus heteroclitus]|uniref:angiopoietin-related protein 3 isoform X2 n=1 Tax=Fundulus heteroclitus TaxID=8078 RepID=UPI00165AC8A0|nr:angiopoietin-related protein 3 isoform X2 [Fundulus heteroclitus]